MGFFGDLFKQVRELYGRLTASQKIAFTLLVVLVGVAMVCLTTWGGREDYVALTAQPADATERAAALERLRQAGITVRENGNDIQVATSDLSRGMAVLAENGALPSDFSRMERTTSNSNSIFKTMEDSRYDRDVQLSEFLGEVIRHMDGIRMAKVVFDVPTPYEAMERKKGTSSVVVWTKDKGATLSSQQVEGIAALITGALRDIPRENVRIVDGQGRAYRVRSADSMTGSVSDRHEEELAYEDLVAKKVQDLLSYLGEVKVTVRASIDFSQRSTQERHVDPNPVEVSSTSKKTTLEPADAAAERKTEQEQSVKNDVSTKVTNLEEAPGKVTDLSVLVLVPRDGVITQLRSEGVEVSEKATAEELSPGLEKIRACVANALGMQDVGKVVVNAVSFPKMAAVEEPAAVAAPAAKSDALTTYGRPTVLAALALVAMLVMWRMIKRPVRVSLDERGANALGLATGDEALLGNLSGLDAETVRRSRMEEKVKSMVTQNPEEAAKLVTRWVRTE